MKVIYQTTEMQNCQRLSNMKYLFIVDGLSDVMPVLHSKSDSSEENIT